MMGTRKECGFSLIELIVVMGILSVLSGVVIETATVAADAQRRTTVVSELDDLAEALDRYYYDFGSFPASLTATGFYGVYVLPGARDNRISDEWGARALYRYQSIGTNPDIVVVYSIGEDAVDSGPAAETWRAPVYGANAGNRKTREELTQIGIAVQNYIHGGGVLTGTWSSWCSTLGLSASLSRDGFGTQFRVDSDGRTVRSAGADRAFGTADDLTW